MKLFGKIFMEILRRAHSVYVLSKYNDFTIENYFRAKHIQVGKNNRIMIRSFGREPSLVKIGNHCTITNNVRFLTHDGATWLFTNRIPHVQSFGKIEIKDNCFIGIGSIILPNVTIGPNSIVGAGSVVTRDVPPGKIVGGNPARIIGDVDDYERRVVERWEILRPPGYLESTHGLSPDEIQKYKRESKKVLVEHLNKVFWGNSD